MPSPTSVRVGAVEVRYAPVGRGMYIHAPDLYVNKTYDGHSWEARHESSGTAVVAPTPQAAADALTARLVELQSAIGEVLGG